MVINSHSLGPMYLCYKPGKWIKWGYHITGVTFQPQHFPSVSWCVALISVISLGACYCFQLLFWKEEAEGFPLSLVFSTKIYLIPWSEDLITTLSTMYSWTGEAVTVSQTNSGQDFIFISLFDLFHRWSREGFWFHSDWDLFRSNLIMDSIFTLKELCPYNRLRSGTRMWDHDS